MELNINASECAALLRFLHSRGIEADEAPAILAEVVGFIVGHAVVASFMTHDEGRQFIEDRLQKRMLAALELEIGAHSSGSPPGGYAQWPGKESRPVIGADGCPVEPES